MKKGQLGDVPLCKTCLVAVYPPANSAGRKDRLWLCSNPDPKECPVGSFMCEVMPVIECERYISITSRMVLESKGNVVWKEVHEIEKEGKSE